MYNPLIRKRNPGLRREFDDGRVCCAYGIRLDRVERRSGLSGPGKQEMGQKARNKALHPLHFKALPTTSATSFARPSQARIRSSAVRAWPWRQFDTVRQGHARTALERIRACEGLAKDVAEVVGNALK